MKLEKNISLDFCDSDLHVERTSDWQLRTDPNGVHYYEAPTGDIWEIAEGDYEWHQLFTWNAAMRESAVQGIRLPSIDEWRQALAICGWDYYSLRERLGLSLAGYRNSSVGSFYDQGDLSYYWSSSPYSTYAYYAYFYSGGGSIANTNYRSYGFSARCLRN